MHCAMLEASQGDSQAHPARCCTSSACDTPFSTASLGALPSARPRRLAAALAPSTAPRDAKDRARVGRE